jgi:precorrin-2 dehydrogenase / sirohydrochlorin ferrochelatase
MDTPPQTPPTAQPVPDDPRPDFPVVVALSGRRCLVVGGGPVAARKARSLLESGARVTVVAPQVTEEIERLASTDDRSSLAAGSLGIRRGRYRGGEAADYQLVVTATGEPAVDAAVVADAVSAGVLVDGAGHDPSGTISMPAVHREGTVTVAVSTGGASPALARWLRDRIAGSLPPGTDTLALLCGEARLALRNAGRPTDALDWAAALDAMAPLVEAGRVDEARALLSEACDLDLPPPPP